MGTPITVRSSGVTFSRSRYVSTACITLKLERRTPLLSEVVPEVYIRITGSSGPPPCAARSSSASPIFSRDAARCPALTSLHEWAAKGAIHCAKSSSQIIRAGSDFSRSASTSPFRNLEGSGSATAPSFTSARNEIQNAAPLYSIRATWSPFLTDNPIWRYPANRSVRAKKRR